jgi:hypothetical protein
MFAGHNIGVTNSSRPADLMVEYLNMILYDKLGALSSTQLGEAWAYPKVSSSDVKPINAQIFPGHPFIHLSIATYTVDLKEIDSVRQQRAQLYTHLS